MRTVKFTIPGRLPGKQRAGRHRQSDGSVRSFNPQQTESAEGMVRWYALIAAREVTTELLVGPLRSSIRVWRLAPASWSKKKALRTRYVTGKPDCDNTEKLILDSMNGVIYRDDSQFAETMFSRQYSVIGQERIEIEIEELVGV